MEGVQSRARRATLDDLPALETLWKRTGLPWEQLEKFLTEFQVVLAEDGSIVAALGLLVEGHEALVHTEALPSDVANPDELRAALWSRIQIVARNQGVIRLWTQEDAPFWTTAGFNPPAPGEVAEARVHFLASEAQWRVCRLSDPQRASRLVQEQFAIREATRAQDATRFQDTIRNIRSGAFLITGLIIAILFGMALYVFLRRPDLMNLLLRR